MMRRRTPRSRSVEQRAASLPAKGIPSIK